MCVCHFFPAAGSIVIHIGDDSSRTYVRRTIQIHIGVTVVSDMCDVTAAQVPAAVKPCIQRRLVWRCESQTGASLMSQNRKRRKLTFVSEFRFPGCLCVEVKWGKHKPIQTSMKTKTQTARKSDPKLHFPDENISEYVYADRNVGLLGFGNLLKTQENKHCLSIKLFLHEAGVLSPKFYFNLVKMHL